jgi:LysM repeat protein/ABC-type branched-subunit amino acid transport system substrate-binding protein
MMKFYKLILAALVTLIIFPIIIQAQVVVEKSKDKVVIDGKQYYIHITKKGETAYSISKAYGISVQDLTKENPFLEGGLKTGQSLRIPMVEKTAKLVTTIKTNKPARDNSKYIYHKLAAGETAFALSKKYGVSEDEIVQSNPGLEINKMPLGYEIAIPRRQFNVTETKLPVPEKSIIQHKVVKGENLYSIAEKYGITVKELRRENKGLLFPKVDEYIRVPVPVVAEVVQPEILKTDSAAIVKEVIINQPERPSEITPVNNLKGSFNIALLLPLYFEENAIRSVIDTSQVVKGKSIVKIINRPDEWIYPESLGFLELYEGVLIAADTLRSLGLDINLHVYDIKSDTIAVTRLIESGNLKDMDLIIGPVYSHNLSIVAAYANTYMIPVISPVPLKNNTPLINNPYLYKVNPSVEVAQDAISKRLINFAHNNFVFIHSDSTHVNPDIDAFKNKIFRELSSKISYEEIKFKEFIFYSRSNLDEDSINRLEHALSDQTKNFIIIASEDPPMISECVANLKTLSKKFDILVMGYPAMRELDNEDWKDYFDLGVELYTPFWIDYNSMDVKNFNRTFRQKFLTEPIESSYAWEGYDLTYYFLSGLAIHGKTFISNPDMHNPDLLMTSFQFRRKSEGSGFENQKLYLIKFANDMELKLLDKPNLNIR